MKKKAKIKTNDKNAKPSDRPVWDDIDSERDDIWRARMLERYPELNTAKGKADDNDAVAE